MDCDADLACEDDAEPACVAVPEVEPVEALLGVAVPVADPLID